MIKVLFLLSIFIAYGCAAESCYISDESVKTLSAKNRNEFTFNIVKGSSGIITVEVTVPKMLNRQNFDSLYLTGISSKTNRPYWGIPVATIPIKSDGLHLSAEMFIPENLIENAWFSITYGSGSCLPYMMYELKKLVSE